MMRLLGVLVLGILCLTVLFGSTGCKRLKPPEKLSKEEQRKKAEEEEKKAKAKEQSDREEKERKAQELTEKLNAEAVRAENAKKAEEEKKVKEKKDLEEKNRKVEEETKKRLKEEAEKKKAAEDAKKASDKKPNQPNGEDPKLEMPKKSSRIDFQSPGRIPTSAYLVALRRPDDFRYSSCLYFDEWDRRRADPGRLMAGLPIRNNLSLES